MGHKSRFGDNGRIVILNIKRFEIFGIKENREDFFQNGNIVQGRCGKTDNVFNDNIVSVKVKSGNVIVEETEIWL